MIFVGPCQLFGRNVTHIHCVGVGGMGLAPLAIYLAESGFEVSGEDDALTDEVKASLKQAKVAFRPLPENCELVVLSSAINANHAAVLAARSRDIHIVRRGELLAEVMRDRKLVAICGSHGKTTTTAMLITILQESGIDAGYVLGGWFKDETIPPAHVGTGDWVVAEIDESDGTIANFAPEITLVVNLDWDHVDHYRQSGDMVATFAGLLHRTRAGVLVNHSCKLKGDLISEAADQQLKQHYTFGEDGDFSGSISSSGKDGMMLQLGGRFEATRVRVKAWGEFNAANAIGALAAANLMGLAINESALAEFPAVRRRQTVLAENDGVVVLEDYAHHPTEITALLGALRQGMAPENRLVVIFQPHRYSRTANFLQNFASSLGVVDRLFLLDVYGAGESEVPGGTTAELVQACALQSSKLGVDYITDDSALFAALNQEVRPGDWVAFVGAGNIDAKARRWLDTRAARPWSQIADKIKKGLSAETKLTCEESLADKTTMRVGGSARLYAEPANVGDLQYLVWSANTEHLPIYPLGRGSNLIVTDDGVDGLVLSLAHSHWSSFELREEGCVWAGAGLRLRKLCGQAAASGLVGFEFLEGIPGNVGGALRMNAGAMGGWMFDIVKEVQLMTMTGEIITRSKSEMQVEYRHCADLDHAIALGVLLRPAASADVEAVKRQMDVYRNKRQESQPRESSAGCIFKNPSGDSAGRLIDEIGLKGERVGDAEVSTAHANFIINRGQATGTDVVELVRRVRVKVLEAKGVTLEPEAQLFGRKWEDVL